MDPAGFGIGCARFHRQPHNGSAPLIDASFPVCNGSLPFCDASFPVFDGPWGVRIETLRAKFPDFEARSTASTLPSADQVIQWGRDVLHM